MVTLSTSQKDAILLDTALRRVTPGTRGHDFVCRIGRSLDMFGSLTPAMTEALITTINPSS